MEALISLLNRVATVLKGVLDRFNADAVNLAIIQSPETWAVAAGGSKVFEFAAPTVPGTTPAVQELYKNKSKDAEVVYVRAANEQQTDIILLLSSTVDGATPMKAQVAIAGVVPQLAIVLRPNGTLYGTIVTTPAGTIVVTNIPLNGRKALYPNQDC